MDFSARFGPDSDPAAEAWKRTISHIPTQFGRLVFVAKLRDAAGHYNYQPLIESMGPEITDRTLANSHYEVFTEWLSLSLANQKADLDGYLRGRQDSRDLERYRDFVPVSAHEVERQLYLSDLQILLAVLRHEPDDAS